ncbi:hypothetical protein DVH24_034280 [Malus domestica]|uniref:Uncharacterized protein n=1 Tax=Malus domestica TaxID=3750 RepID=A0A498IW01_MALDO|nr:hypothetical protein DVH24_034280 [Malus domestica]
MSYPYQITHLAEQAWLSSEVGRISLIASKHGDSGIATLFDPVLPGAIKSITRLLRQLISLEDGQLSKDHAFRSKLEYVLLVFFLSGYPMLVEYVMMKP